MSEKIFNARFAQKIDTLTAWASSNIVLKAGEIAFATETVDITMDAKDGGATIKQPIILAKIGDGSKTFANLPYSFYAKASDVYAWAKKDEAGHKEDIKDWFPNVVNNLELENNILKVTPLKGEPYVLNLATDEELELLKDRVKTLEDANLDGRIKTIEDADLDNRIKTIEDDYVTNTAFGEFKEANTKAISDAQAAAEAKVTEHTTAVNNKIGDIGDKSVAAVIEDVTTDVGKVDDLSTTNKTVVTAINEVLAAVGTGGTAAVVTIEKSIDGLTYTVKQGDATVGTIDIPKDMVVSSGRVVVNPDGQPEGTYIELTLANATQDKVYVNVGTLVDIYKAKAEAAQVQVAIDSATREISATIVAGSITSTELADNAVITAKIADANVTKAKLSTAVQSTLDYADSVKNGEAVPNATKAADADKLGGYEPSYYVNGFGLANILEGYVTLETYNTSINDITNSYGAVDSRVTNLDNSLAPVAKSGKLSDLDKTFGKGITDIIFDAGNASGYNA